MRIPVLIFAIVFLVEEKILSQSPSANIVVSSEVKMHLGKPVLFINSTPQCPMVYALTDVPGGRWSWEEVPRYNLKSFCSIGVNIIQVDLFMDHFWREDGTLTMDTTQKQLRGVLDVCPTASIIIRLHVNPPKWWQKKHPEENTIYADSEPKKDISWGIQRIIEDDEETPERTSLASEKWKTEATPVLKKFLNNLRNMPEGNALAGIQVAGGVYGEWHYWGFLNNEPDMNDAMVQYFRGWLKGKYGTAQALQAAWNDKTISFANATVPTVEERRSTTAGIFRDPAKERKVIDYYEAQHQVVADDIIYFCRLMKENWPRPIITGAFYGYFYAVFGREVVGGHLQFQRVLDSRYVDFLCGPGTYYPEATKVGDPYRSRSLINSVTLHGKLWLDEMDQQPPLVPLKDTTYQVNLDKSIANTRRNIMSTASKGHGLWFYDFGPAGMNGGPRLVDHGTWGWWDEPSLRDNIKKVKAIVDKTISLPYQSDADVLLVHDTESFYYVGSEKRFTEIAHWSNNWIPVALYRSGTVHDVIDLDDLDKINLEQYRVIIFANTYLLSAERKKFIRDRVARNNRHLVWFYAPGYTDGKALNTKFISDVTGIAVDKIEPIKKTSVTVNSSIVPSLQYPVKNLALDPMFVVTDPKAEKLGVVTGTSHTALAKKIHKTSVSWYLAIPPDNVKFWRYLLKEGGAHFYNESGDIFYSGNGILTVHTKDGGKRNIRLKDGKEIKISLPENSTTLLNSNTGEIILE